MGIKHYSLFQKTKDGDVSCISTYLNLTSIKKKVNYFQLIKPFKALNNYEFNNERTR